MKLLHLDSSILGDASASRQLSAALVDAWKSRETGVQVTYRDLASDALSHLSAASLLAAGTPEQLRDAAQAHEVALAEATLEEFLAADALVIGAPMYNFTIPTQLKAWIDRIAIAGKTFAYDENGPKGLAGGKKVVIVSTAGGIHAGQPSGQAHEDYLILVLRFLGITDIEVVRAEGLAYGEEPKASALRDARAQIGALFASA
ncbi:FMN-dependent NADH-azoreductase [Phytopseudomonas dryadis]|uniref:FMN dependent NADH:quinone oxidoreductase n=1 Tax=Phytopseudomonas dryadis TaxID=2487520 RepID=A0A4V2KD65_9GAMM|nr:MULTISPECIES: FMN-dependent NADH-azoreductase [Pseudomonas]TBU97696.1 FMN-dependent NADH-azoreductase [Pseudomonas dryadis]TBV10151.1 FMN-dependent NADH-azoreductase [Pseudomonas dryadis]TBV19018.1 FMN-dependent NADH-azoreductase [Pseudomonas sp. FRB 230]